MPIAVVGHNGAPTQVATMADVSGDAYVLPAATPTVIGGVKQAMTVPDVVTAPVTDFTTAQAAIDAITTNMSELHQALRNAGIMM